MVAERIAFWTPLAEDDGRAISADMPAEPVLVRCAPADLVAAVDALVQNVFAHTPDGVAMRISVSPLADGGGELIVGDDGPGFAIEDAVRGAGSGRSTGLGLDIARRTAEAAGGAMEIRRGPVGGAAVVLTFGSPEVARLALA